MNINEFCRGVSKAGAGGFDIPETVESFYFAFGYYDYLRDSKHRDRVSHNEAINSVRTADKAGECGFELALDVIDTYEFKQVYERGD